MYEGGVDPFISQPFGYGPRQCIGKQTVQMWWGW